jgi:phage tail protein X
MGEHRNCAVDDMCYRSVGHSCGLASEINEVRPGPSDAGTSIEACEARVTSLYLSAANGRHYTSIA